MNSSGKEFIELIREIQKESEKHNNPARMTAFQICMMLDGSGEFGDGEQKFKVVTVDGKPVEFYHHDL